MQERNTQGKFVLNVDILFAIKETIPFSLVHISCVVSLIILLVLYFYNQPL